MSSLKPSRLNKLLAGLLCASLWRKGALCCTLNCSCFNDVENPEAQRHRAQEAKWNYRTEKLASQRERKGEVKESKEAAKEKRRQAKRETSRIDPIIAKQGTKSEAEVRSSLSVARTTPSQDATTRNDAEDDDPTVKGAEIDAAKAVDGKKDGRNVKKAKRAKSRADRSQKRSAKKGTR